MNELALFAGAGGGILGGKLLGWRTVCAVEIDAYCASVLVARQNDGSLETFPVWDDVRTFDGTKWRGIIDVVSGGFPCQDISCAGRGEGINGARSGLWTEFARILGEVRPRFVFVENVPALLVRGGVRVLGDLAALGYDAKWGVVSAADCGAPHLRERIWIVADAADNGRKQCVSDREASQSSQGSAVAGSGEGVPDANGSMRERRADEPWREPEGRIALERPGWWIVEPDVGRVAHGVAARVDKLRALGNGQVPSVAALAWRILGGPG